MTTDPFQLALRVVRGWTRFYTWRLPPDLRDRRRTEIDSDLWESEHDQAGASPLSSAAHVLGRFVRGMPADLAWRREHADGHVRHVTRQLIWAIGALALVTAWWVFGLMRTQALPEPAGGPMRFVGGPPPPPETEPR
jgi:hypothetical protein